MGKLYVIGIGPGGLEHMTLRAKDAIEESNIIIGYNKYIDMIKPIVEDKELFSTGMRGEESRCRKALELSKENNIVALISTGDSGIYGMAGLILQMKEDENVEIIPGVTASSAAGSVVGAPLMHDNCNISLSDLMTPYDLIKKRVRNAADADMVISLYNPRSKGRSEHLANAFKIMGEFKDGSTPVGIVKDVGREDQEKFICTFDTMDFERVDMTTMVIIGNKSTYIHDDLMITPRGYTV